mmetsp:Transcript_9885/g.40062  ORF Transcript_9885/g.40062 Transcript_9885/m.40062 type:complete len:257 (-) Transcript_9885:17-787(-)
MDGLGRESFSESLACASLAHSRRTTPSESPWHMRRGVSLFSSETLARAFSGCGRYPLSATTPASFFSSWKQEKRLVAAPWEKPPMMMRSEGIPFAISSSRWFSSICFASSTPSRACAALLPSSLMSYHAGIIMPPLIVTGLSGAVGKTQRRWGSDGCNISPTSFHPFPVSPRPWRKITVPVCFVLGSSTTVGPCCGSTEAKLEQARSPDMMLLTAAGPTIVVPNTASSKPPRKQPTPCAVLSRLRPTREFLPTSTV